ncbi:Cytochrome P450 87A3 [Linum perenne]
MLGDLQMIWVIGSSLLVVALSFWVFRWKNPRCSNGGKLPPGSMGFPLIGETIQFLLPSKSIDTHAFIKTRVQKYGPLFKTSLVGRPVVVSTDPEFSYNLLLQDGKLVERWYSGSAAQVLSRDAKSNASVIHTYKCLTQLIFGRFGYEPLKKGTLMAELQDTIAMSFQLWSQLPQVELKAVTSKMILNFMGKKLFSYEPSERLGEGLITFLEEVLKFPINIPGITSSRRCFKSYKKLKEIIADTLESRKKLSREKREDFLDDALAMMEKEDFLTDKFVVGMIAGLTLASFEAMSSTIVLAIKFLSENPLAIQKLREENEEILKNRKDPTCGLSWEEYKSMTYTHYVIKESLRIASVAPGILRRTLTDIDIDGYTIPKGWAIFVVPSAIQLSSTYYEDPLSFNPSRWEGMSAMESAKKYIAFGGGARSCSGSELTNAVMAIFLHVLVTNYRYVFYRTLIELNQFELKHSSNYYFGSWKTIKTGEIARTPVLGFGDGLHVQFHPLKVET